MDIKLEKLISMASGQNRDDLDINKIPLDVRGQIDDALESVFMGKSIMKWVQGGTLGAAWKASLDELRDEMFAIPKTSIMVEYLRIAVFAHRARWEIKMLQSNERKSVAELSETEINNMTEYANTLRKSGMQTIQKILQNNSGTGVARRPEYQNQMQMDRSRSREYDERVRKR